MIRTLVLVVVGAALGVAATLFLVQRNSASKLDDSPLALFSSDALTMPAPASVPAPDVSRDFYRRLADADARELARMIADTAAEPPSTDRDLSLAVLLRRHAELDVVGAVRLAREVRVRGAALGSVYSAWARRAPAQVLAALSTISNPEDAADVALALIETLGNDAQAVERVAAVLAERDDESLLRTGTVPVGPIIAPTVVAPPRSPLALLAARWADLGPRHALAVARELRDERVRMVFEAAALRAVARVAPNDVFAELANRRSGNSAQLGALGGAVVELARTDPERVLSAVSGLPVDIRRLAESAAMQQLAERDPAAALRYLEQMPVGMERQALVRVIARAYGKRDAAAALEWARSMGGQQGLVAAVIGGVAEQDPQRALDLALELTSPIERMQAMQFAVGFARTDAEAEAIANRLLAADDAALRDSLAYGVVTTWASRSPDSAMRWLLGSGQNASPNVYQQTGQVLAMRDPRTAIGYSAQIPPAALEQWINGVAQGYAQNDPQGAIDWLRQYAGEPWYDRTAGMVAMSLAQRDGAAAARLVDELDAERLGMQGQQLASMIATNWANGDPAAAAAWAADRRTDAERDMAVRGVVGVWSSQDFAGARQWALRLPQGGTRDAALSMLLTTSAYNSTSELDAAILNGFASDAARDSAVMQVVQGMAYNDPERARRIVDLHVTDPSARAQAERMIEAANNNGRALRPGVGIAPGMRAVPPSIVMQRPK